jgi:beta-N-acetylhexosaminidase
MFRYYSLGLLLAIIVGMMALMSWSPSEEVPVSPDEKVWVDSVFQSMTFDQRLGQLFMVAAYSNKDEAHIRKIEQLVSQYNIGGVMFMQGGPYRQAVLTNRFQRQSKVPLLIAMDVEWGLNMRLDSSMHFARQMTLGAIEDDKYVYLMGREIALKLKRLGVQVSFSPVIDVNSNPNNPVIGNRSFGESTEEVTRRGIAYIKGLQDHGVIAVAKHFPGHGDTDTDSHHTLPSVQHDMKRLSEVELYPFKKSFEAGVMGVMVAHLYMPKLDSAINRASTLSYNLVTTLLKEKMKYKGLVFTDALNMKGVTCCYKRGEVDALALLAGNDVLLFSEDVPTAIGKIKEALQEGKITAEEIDSRVMKILRAKYWAGLNAYKPVDLKNLIEDVDRPVSLAVQQQLYENAVTVVANKDNLLPFKMLDTARFASVSIGFNPENTMQRTLGNYAPFTHLQVPDRFAPDSVFAKVFNKLHDFDVVVVSLHGLNNTAARDFGIGSGTRKFIQLLQRQPGKKVVVTVLGNAYSLKYFEDSNWLVCAYEDNPASQLVVPQVLFGALPSKGKLPVTASAKFKAGTGIPTPAINRLRYGIPELVGVDSKILSQINNIALEAITYAATPGCQVLVAKDGVVIFNKSFGYHTYDKVTPVTNQTLYDIASLTKVTATLQAVMFLKDQGKLNLDERLVTYLPEVKGTNKENLLIRDILVHQAGLQSTISHYRRTIDSKGVKPAYYASTRSELFPNEVAPGLYTTRAIEDSVWVWTLRSGLIPKKKGQSKYEYKYSDVGLAILKRLAEKQLNQPLDEFMEQNFYSPLGLSTLTYNPLAKFPRERIAPTENDTWYRKTLVWGNPHDQGAALVGGVAGHAGLFSNANDLAILMQMNLKNGNYGGQRYFKNNVVTEFSKTQPQYPGNRRGLGWDKGEPEGNGPTSKLASPMTFGHTGFTGTAAWVDPENKIVYIFLSNRIYPDPGNTKLVQYNIRTRIHDVIYQAMRAKT